MNLYSETEKSKWYKNIADEAFEYLGREHRAGDIVSIYSHYQITNMSFLKTFNAS